jgi:hypothetical protein
MEFYGSIDSLLEYSLKGFPAYFAHQTVQPKKEQSDSLEYLLQEKVDSLSEILAQIDRDIKSRNDLSKDVIGQIDHDYRYIKTKYFELEQWMFGHNKWAEQRRSALEKELDALNKEKRQEEVQCWQDIAQLTREFRDWFKQYCDLMQRIKIVIPDMSAKKPLKRFHSIENESKRNRNEFG